MKKLACIALMGLSLVGVVSFAATPPTPFPEPSLSCLKAYPLQKTPTPADLAGYCGCYQRSAISQCVLLADHGYAPMRTCTGSFTTLVSLTCANEGMRGIQTFCTNNVAKLNASGDKITTVQNCIDDVGYICDSGGESSCAPYWVK